MTSAFVVGSSGLVGGFIISTLASLQTIAKVNTIARRQLDFSDAKVNVLVDSDSSKWSEKIAAFQPPPSVFYSALGTTKAKAGGVANQRKVDYDLSLELAKAAKAAGVKVYVLISSFGASASSRSPYLKMKGDLEEDVIKLGFEHTVIIRPGLIIGTRKESRLLEGIVQRVAIAAGAVSTHWLKDGWAQNADVIAKAAISAGLKGSEGDAPKVWELGGADVIRLGRTEWKF